MEERHEDSDLAIDRVDGRRARRRRLRHGGFIAGDDRAGP
jgi:hypothetical protein